MKKKIIDLTLEERLQFCDSHIRCIECPLHYGEHYINASPCYSPIYQKYYPVEFLEKEVKI